MSRRPTGNRLWHFRFIFRLKTAVSIKRRRLICAFRVKPKCFIGTFPVKKTACIDFNCADRSHAPWIGNNWQFSFAGVLSNWFPKSLYPGQGWWGSAVFGIKRVAQPLYPAQAHVETAVFRLRLKRAGAVSIALRALLLRPG